MRCIARERGAPHGPAGLVQVIVMAAFQAFIGDWAGHEEEVGECTVLEVSVKVADLLAAWISNERFIN